MNQDLAVELARFALAGGVSTEALIDASDRLERECLSNAEGYIGRFLLRQDTNQWADVVFWGSREYAQKTKEAMLSSDAGRAYLDCMKTLDTDMSPKDAVLFRVCRAYGAVDF